MNADQIAKRLERVDSEAAGNELHNEAHRRIAEIEQRRRQIRYGGTIGGGNPPERDRAIRKGADAGQQLDDELRALDAEHDRCGQLAAMAMEAGMKAQAELVAREVPRAAARLPSLQRAVEKARDALRVALAEHNAAITAVASFQDAGVPRPVSDEDIVAQIRLRDSLWALPDLAVNGPRETDVEAFKAYHLNVGNRQASIRVRTRHDHSFLFDGRDAVVPIFKSA